MYCNSECFTTKEVSEILVSLGYEEGSAEFCLQWGRRFVSAATIGCTGTLWVDNPKLVLNAEDKARAAAARENRPFNHTEPMVGRLPGQKARELYGRSWDCESLRPGVGV